MAFSCTCSLRLRNMRLSTPSLCCAKPPRVQWCDCPVLLYGLTVRKIPATSVQLVTQGRLQKKRYKLGTLSQVRLPPPPPSELGTSLSEILLTVFFKFVELGLTDQFSSILVPKHFRRFGHSIFGFRPPPPCWYNVPSS